MFKNGSKNRGWYPSFPRPFSTLAPKAIFGCTLVTFWLPFGTVWIQFWRPRRLLGALWLPFGYPLGSILTCGTLLNSFWLLFLNFQSFSSLFRYLVCFRFRFGRSSDAKTIFGAPDPARNPQQNYSRISTVGTPPFLGPGRVCCRRQLKIRPGPEAPEACWGHGLACSLPITHPTSALTLSLSLEYL